MDAERPMMSDWVWRASSSLRARFSATRARFSKAFRTVRTSSLRRKGLVTKS